MEGGRAYKNLEVEVRPAGLEFQTSGFWNLNRIFEEDANFQISDGPSEREGAKEKKAADSFGCLQGAWCGI